MNKAFDKILEDLSKVPTEYRHEEYNKAIWDVIRFIKKSAPKYNIDWIPCNVRLPKRNKPVLCWVKSTTIASGETYIIGSCDNGFWFLQTYEIGHHHFPVKDYKVIAWQPLPEPYEGETCRRAISVTAELDKRIENSDADFIDAEFLGGIENE